MGIFTKDETELEIKPQDLEKTEKTEKTEKKEEPKKEPKKRKARARKPKASKPKTPTPRANPIGSTPTAKEFKRAFAIARRNVVNPEHYEFFDNAIGKTYNNERFDPHESKAAFDMAITHGTRVKVGLGTLLATVGSITAKGQGWEIGMDDSSEGPVAIIEGSDIILDNAIFPDGAMFYFEVIFGSGSDNNVYVQNFSGYDNATFAGGIGNNFGNPVYDKLSGTIHRLPFFYKVGDPVSGPGSVESNNFKFKFKGGNIDSKVYISKITLYRVDV